MKKILTIAFLLCLVCSTAFADKVYTDPHGVSLDIPDGYQLVAKRELPTENKYETTFADSAAIEKAQKEIMITSQISSSGPPNTINDFSEQELADISNDVFKKLATINIKALNNPNYKKVTVNGYPAIVIILDETYQYNNYLVYGYYIIKDTKVITITYACPKNKSDEFLPIIEKSINTLYIE
ncbi:hypothetical protein [Pectinatus frisingensis]|uniref:hypothetical protein n=1 Tax=Pectinatus frisingensis TaxID=865 RepID=UPI0018C72CAE|nr:hypothetical protein [Pectinatus frisingensis]